LAQGSLVAPSPSAAFEAEQQPARKTISRGFWSSAWRRFRRDRVSLIALGVLLLIVIVSATIGTVTALQVYLVITPRQPRQHTYLVVNATISTEAGKYYQYSVHIPSGNRNLLLSGSFTVIPSQAGLLVLVMNQANFDNWRNGIPAVKYYDSGQSTPGDFSISFPEGDDTYYVVYANYATTALQVQTLVLLYYSS